MTGGKKCQRLGHGCCQLYWPGHNAHWIHAKRIGGTPWGWRDAIVTTVEGRWVTVTYVLEGTQLRLWHHERLSSEIHPGDLVRVHEQYNVLGGPFGWLNVIVEGGLGAVPEPAEPALWADQTTGGVQDLSTGRALALDHAYPDADL